MVAPRFSAIKYKEDLDFVIGFEGDSVVKVSPGDKVSQDSVILEGQSSSVLQSVNLAKELGVNTDKVFNYLQKVDGEIVEEGDVIASRTISLGIAERIVKSRYNGRVDLSRIGAGFVDVKSPYVDVEIKAGISGVVDSVLPGRSMQKEIVFSIAGYYFNPFLSVGSSVSGKLSVLGNGDSVFHERIDVSKFEDRVVVTGRRLTLKLYESLVEAGATAVISGAISLEDFNSLGGNFAIPIVITEGWGTIPINSILLSLLIEEKDSPVYLDMDDNRVNIFPVVSGSAYKLGKDSYVTEIWKGQAVQIWDQPYWGYSGQVSEVYNEEELVSVKFSSGQKIVTSPQSLVIID